MNNEAVRKALKMANVPGVMARMRWDQRLLKKKLGLDLPLAVNYFTASSA